RQPGAMCCRTQGRCSPASPGQRSDLAWCWAPPHWVCSWCPTACVTNSIRGRGEPAKRGSVNGMSHFHTEIREQPAVLQGLLDQEAVRAAAAKLRERVPAFIATLARGSSGNAAAF